MRQIIAAIAALCLLLLIGCAGTPVQESKSDRGASKLSMRLATHPDFLRIVFEGPSDMVKGAVVATPDEETITVRFPGPVVITHEQKGIVTPEKPFEAHGGVAMVLTDATCTFIVLNLRDIKVATLSSPPRLVIDSYLSAIAKEQPSEQPEIGKNTFRKGSEPNSFRGILWGAGVKKVSGLNRVRSDPSFGGIELYTRKSDTMRLGGAQLDTIEYGFWQGRFSNVIIRSAGFTNWLNLRDATFARFGAGYKPSEYSETYWWFGETTVAKLDYHEVPEVGFLYLYSKQIMNEQEDYTRQKAAEGARKGF